MHVSFLTNEYPHEKTPSGGGIGTSIKNLASGLVKNNVKVTVFVIYAAHNLIFYDKGVRIVCIPSKNYWVLTWYFYRRYINSYINKFIVKDNIDCIEVADWQGFSAFSKYRCPVVVKLHGSYTYFNYLANRHRNKALSLFEGNALRRADAIVSVSQFTLDQTNKIFRNLNIGAQTVIHNGIDVDKFKYCHKDNKSKIKKILYFGCLTRKKGVLDIPYIFNKIHENDENIILTLVGGDAIDYLSGRSTWEMMQELFTHKALGNVLYLGRVSYGDVFTHLIESDVCIFPSYAEAFPVSWLEAMACGIPIVASNIGWAKEVIINEHSGFLVNPLNHQLFASKVLELLKDNQISKKISNNAYKRLLKYFQLNKISGDYEKFYRDLIQL